MVKSTFNIGDQYLSTQQEDFQAKGAFNSKNILGNPYIDSIDASKFQTIETDKQNKLGSSRGTNHKALETPAFNTAFSSASHTAT